MALRDSSAGLAALVRNQTYQYADWHRDAGRHPCWDRAGLAGDEDWKENLVHAGQFWIIK